MLGARRTPRRLWFVGDLPRTDAGKLRRAALPAWVGFDADVQSTVDPGPFRAADSAIERAVAALWSHVLVRKEFPHDADFVALGGNASTGAELVRAVRFAFGVDVPLQALFDDAHSIEGMARRIARARGAWPTVPGVV